MTVILGFVAGLLAVLLLGAPMPVKRLEVAICDLKFRLGRPPSAPP